MSVAFIWDDYVIKPIILSLLLCGLITFLVWKISFNEYGTTRNPVSLHTPFSKAQNHVGLSMGKTSDSTIEVLTDATIPDGWYKDPKLFALERRAIFSKTWLCVTHTSRFQKSGDYITFNVAGFPFFLILGKDSIIRGFHNVCRHRAYTVTKKAVGSSLILGCRYHGWSYDTKGKLVKAPHFDDLPEFKKEENSLYQIWVRSNRQGLVFINFDAIWDIDGPNAEETQQFAIKPTTMMTSKPVTSWQLEGKFNWKFAASQTPRGKKDFSPDRTGASQLLDLLKQISNRSKSLEIQQFPITQIVQIPNTSFWTMTILEPTSSTQTSIRCDVYSTQSNFNTIRHASILDRMEENFTRDVHALEQSSTTSSESTISKLSETILVQLEQHKRMERKSGTQIFAAVDQASYASASCGVAERLCRELDSLAETSMGCLSSSENLAW